MVDRTNAVSAIACFAIVGFRHLKEYRSKMKSALETQEDPVAANIETVMPGVVQMQRATEAKVAQVDSNITSVDKKVAHLLEKMNALGEAIEDVGPDLQSHLYASQVSFCRLLCLVYIGDLLNPSYCKLHCSTLLIFAN
jgi:hypothetical protein